MLSITKLNIVILSLVILGVVVSKKARRTKPGNTKGWKYHSTIDLLFDWFGLVCFANKNKNCKLSYS